MSTALIPSEEKGLKGLAPAAAPTQQVQAPQYVQGFEGIAQQPFPSEAAKVLADGVSPDEVEIKPDGIVFLPGVAYRRILTRAFGAGAWALAPRSPVRSKPDGGAELVIYHGALFVLGRFVSEAIGECKYYPSNDGMTYASAVEGARTDCLTRCCKDLGIATELWDPTWRAWWQKNYARCEMKTAQSGKWAGKERAHWSKLAQPIKGGKAPTGRNVGPISAALESGMAKVANELKNDATDSQVAPTTDLESPPAAASKGGSPRTVRRGQSVQAPYRGDDTAVEGIAVSEGVNPGAGGQAAVFERPSDDPGNPEEATRENGDTGEAATDGDVKMLRTQVGKLGWASPKARSWLKATFGESTPTALTKDQAAAALVLLLAAQQGDDDGPYAAAYDKLKAEGRVL